MSADAINTTNPLTFKVVYNSQHGGFSVPEELFDCHKDEVDDYIHDGHFFHRSCPNLINYVESGGLAPLEGLHKDYPKRLCTYKIREVPIEYKNTPAWGISEYDGLEFVWWSKDKLIEFRVLNAIKNMDVDTKSHDDLKSVIIELQKELKQLRPKYESFNFTYDKPNSYSGM